MSIVQVVCDANALILSTDSRSSNLDGGDVSDVETKLFEVAPGTFYAAVGTTCAADFMVERARKIATDSKTTDIQLIAREVARASIPYLGMLLERFRANHDEISRRKVSGEGVLHAHVMAGQTSGGKFGYVSQTFWAQPGGAIGYTTESYFDAPERKIVTHSALPAEQMAKIAQGLASNPKTWSDPIDQVSMRFLEATARASSFIGGDWQIVRLDSTGAHWLSRPEWAANSSAVPAGERLLHGANSVTVTAGGIAIVGGVLTSPTITIPAGTVTMTISPTAHLGGPGMSIIDSGAVDRTTMIYAGMLSAYQSSNPNYKAELSPGFLSLQDASGNQAGLHPAMLMVGALPLSSPGAGTKRFWADPSDGYRVKYAV